VLLEGRERVAVLRGKARRGADRAVAGDRVTFDPATLDEEVLGIDSVEPRATLLARRVPDGRGTRPIAANVDQVVVVMATADPDPVLQLLDRLLLVSDGNEIPAWVVANKTDLAPATAIERHLHAAGYEVVPVSVREGTGIDTLRRRLTGKESVLTGPSGAGKSSLLNALEPDLGLRVGEISERIGRGRHTTVTARMVPLAAGGFVVDTPGFSDVGLWEIPREALPLCFPEFRPFIDECRYGNCAHRGERECAVRAQVEAGAIPVERYQSYRTLWDEIAAQPAEWE